MANPVDPQPTDATWQHLFQPQRGGELATADGGDEPAAPNQPRPQRLDQSLVDTIAQQRREAMLAARQRQGTSAHELLARCRQLNAQHRCPGRCVFTGQLRPGQMP